MANSITRHAHTMPHGGTFPAAHVRAAGQVHSEWLAIGRALFGGFFVFNGIHHFTDVGMMAAYAGAKGTPSPELAVLASGALIVLGGLSLLLGLWTRLGALMISVFLIIVTPVMHNFWAQADPQMRLNDMGHFMKNVALLGGACMAAAIPTPWPGSVDAHRHTS
jgi:uncharacterized membrane protein YphA (DoxX/SURF4 family)